MATAHGQDAAERRRAQRRNRLMVRFGYDVTVNLVANILAASLVALLLETFGVIHPNTALTVLTALAILFALTVGYSTYYIVNRGKLTFWSRFGMAYLAVLICVVIGSLIHEIIF